MNYPGPSALAPGPDDEQWMRDHGYSDAEIAAAGVEAAPRYRAVRLSDVRRTTVEWLWESYIPAGKLTVFDGDPGDGKSTMGCDLAARISNGSTMPDGSAAKVGTVLLLSAEDGISDTIAPRLAAAGADLSRVVVLDETYDEDEETGRRTPRPIEIPGDLGMIEHLVRKEGVRLVIIDPLTAFLNKVDSHNDQSVRRALHPISKMAESTGAAFVVIRHLNKASGGKAIYRGGGSIGIIGAARAGFLIAPDPDDESGARRLMAVVKMNIATKPPTMAYRLVDAPEFGCARVEWEGTSAYRIEQLVSVESDEERSERKGASDFLLDVLAKGPARVKDVQDEARNGWGISESSLNRARRKLGIQASKIGSEWWIELPASK